MMTESFLDVARVLTGLFCLFLLMFGIRWQARTFRGDEASGQRRMWSALILALMCILGAIVWVTYAYVDPRSNMTVVNAVGYVLAIGVLSVAFLLKTWLGPLLVTSAASWTAYMFVAYGELQLLPIFELLVRGLFENAPKGATAIFASLTIFHATIGAAITSYNAPYVGD